MCFDKTSSNTDRHRGACVHLEKLLGRDLLHIGCHHHILELIAGVAFSTAMGSSSAPDVLFKKFKERWQCIDKTAFEDSSTDEYTTSAVADIKDEMVTLLKKVVNVSQPRDDYMEYGVPRACNHFLRICTSSWHPLCSTRSHSPRTVDGKGNLLIQTLDVSLAVRADCLPDYRITKTLHLLFPHLC